MQNSKQHNFTPNGKIELNIKSYEQQEEEALLVLSDIICNIIIKEINKHESNENTDRDTT